MALQWNFQNCKGICENGKVKDAEVLKWKDILIWTSMCVGLNGITEKNLKVWEKRLNTMNKLNYFMGQEGEKGVNVPFEIVKKCVGFTTNVSTKTEAKFNKNVLESI